MQTLSVIRTTLPLPASVPRRTIRIFTDAIPCSCKGFQAGLSTRRHSGMGFAFCAPVTIDPLRSTPSLRYAIPSRFRSRSSMLPFHLRQSWDCVGCAPDQSRSPHNGHLRYFQSRPHQRGQYCHPAKFCNATRCVGSKPTASYDDPIHFNPTRKWRRWGDATQHFEHPL